LFHTRQNEQHDLFGTRTSNEYLDQSNVTAISKTKPIQSAVKLLPLAGTFITHKEANSMQEPMYLDKTGALISHSEACIKYTALQQLALFYASDSDDE